MRRVVVEFQVLSLREVVHANTVHDPADAKPAQGQSVEDANPANKLPSHQNIMQLHCLSMQDGKRTDIFGGSSVECRAVR